MTVLGRRDFLRRTAMAAAAASASSLVPDVVFGAEVARLLEGGQALDWRRTPCRFCGVGCGLLVGIEDGRAVAVRGDPDSSVNRGLACVKGYLSVQALYGTDRITRAQVRRNGRLVEVPVGEALDLVARRLRETVDAHGADAVAIYGSGQWTIPDGYTASKLFKGAIGTNNVEANARLCMSSAVAGFHSTFGLDEPMGCYEDIDHADVFVLWGNNMAEAHPVLFSRMLDERRRRPDVQIVDLATRTTRTSYAADRSLLFAPQADLAIANAICHEIVRNDWVDHDFVEHHVAFKRGRTDIGYGLDEEAPPFREQASDASWEDYVEFLNDYPPERAAEISGLPAPDIRWLASLYGDPSRRVMSLWCMGVNQHTRGTWMNNLIYNIHLLAGKIATPGNSPFSLTGQPSACGTVREVGTLTHGLPGGVVTDPERRRMAEEIWEVPEGTIPSEPTHHTMSMFRALDEGEIRFMWVQVTNPMVSLPDLARYREAAEKPDRFLVVSDVYPTPTTAVADVVLPSAMWIEREGLFGNSERRTQYFPRMIEPPGEAMSDTWQLIEVARRLGYGEIFPDSQESHIEEIWAEYVRFHDSPEHRMAPLELLRTRPGVMWPYVDGHETRWRYNTATDPAADPEHGAYDFYGHSDHRAWIWIRPYEPPPEWPDDEYPFWLSTGRVVEHWHTGSMTRRIPTLHQALPSTYVELHPRDAQVLGVRDREWVRLVSRRGAVELQARLDYRGRPPPGQVFVPFFDESRLVNELTLDAYCPISGQPDYKKCAVRVERLAR